MHTRRVRNAVAAVATLAATAWIGPIPTPSANAVFTPRVLFSQDLGDGRILTRFTQGVTVVATQGTQVVFETTTLSETERGLAIGLVPPDYDENGSSRAGEQYRASGRSPEKDDRALEYSQNQARSEANANQQASRTPTEKGTVRTMAASGSDAGDVYDSGCACDQRPARHRRGRPGEQDGRTP